MTRLVEAVEEIKQIARVDPVVGADGAVLLLERISPALENVDSSSGAVGSAVNRTIAELVPVIAGAPADLPTRTEWLERLFDAHAADQIPYIEHLAEYWGELCASTDVASEWADRLITITRLAMASDRATRGYFHGTSVCLSALFAAARYEELIEVVQHDVLWTYKRWAVKALAALGRRAEAVVYAEQCRSPWASDLDIDRMCEQLLLDSGQADDAFARYGLSANRAGTYLAWFRAVAKKYPQRPRAAILADLVQHTPGDEGKWFAAAKDAKLFDEDPHASGQGFCSGQPRIRRGSRARGPSLARWRVRLRDYEPRRESRLRPHADGRHQCRRSRGDRAAYSLPLQPSDGSHRIRCRCHRSGTWAALRRVSAAKPYRS